MIGNVFISYRRDLSSEVAGRIAMELRKRLSRCKPYLDVESIAVGTNFVDVIETQLALTDVVLVLISPGWLDVRDKDGKLRLWQPKDHVRAEVAAALKRGVEIIPVLIDGAQMPNETELPGSLRDLIYWNAIDIRSQFWEDDIFRLCAAVEPKLPERHISLFLAGISMPSAAFLLPYFLISALILFAAHVLQVHFIPSDFSTDYDNGTRDLGFFYALNWSAVLFVLWPLVLYLSHHVLRETQGFIEKIKSSELVVFIDPEGQRKPRSPDAIWRRVLHRSSLFVMMLTFLTIVLSGYNGYQYSGRWPVEEFPYTEFLKISTGMDWQVAWAVDKEFADRSIGIKFLSFFVYEFYNFGWIMKFSVFVFLIFLLTELENVAQSAGNYKAEKLLLDPSDPDAGGFSAFERIQTSICAVAILSICAMYLMAMRNYFLPPGCLPTILSDGQALTSHCYFTLGIVDTSARILIDLFVGVGTPSGSDWSILFNKISNEHNSFTIGPVFENMLVIGLFFYVNDKLVGTLRHCQQNLRTVDATSLVASDLVHRLRRRSWYTVTLLLLGLLSALFPNFSVVFLIALTVWSIRGVLTLTTAVRGFA
ncbi:toll/interleukin-1 receptor domain-containing protein [Pelagibius sp. Alg239-R121]|uniref:toll/interleukin-1 receptor domain-containing protein n=1 Tax=Pelagibius sp. Alg239-R121 TaxID=2993448 RepID=UPI0024A759DD|nr:toll/interleukin-1 receptor domain-containing protein [Pelagibius sp. Alg239-R121]